VRLRRSGPQCRCGGIGACLADYAAHRGAQPIDRLPAVPIPGEDPMATVGQVRVGDATLPKRVYEAGEVLGGTAGILIRTL
jgi:hypothetical protein